MSSPSNSISTTIYNEALFSALPRASTIAQLTIRQTKKLDSGRAVPVDQVPRGLPKSSVSRNLEPPEPDKEALEIPEHRKTRLDAYRAGEEKLIHAIIDGKLANLTSFTWDTDPPLYDVRSGVSLVIDGQELDIWTALGKRCPKLVHLQVLDSAEYNYVHSAMDNALDSVMGFAPVIMRNERPFAHVLPVHDSSIFDAIKGLRSFVYRCYSYKHGKDEIPMDRLCGMLRASPNLEVLKLSFSVYGMRGTETYSASLDPLFETGKPVVFSSLHTFDVCAVRASPENAIVFFSANPSLRIVKVSHEGGYNTTDDNFGQNQAVLPEGVLPNVVEFDVGGMEGPGK